MTGVFTGGLLPPGDGSVRRQPEEAIEDDLHATAKGWRRMSRASKLAYIACAHALADASGLVGAPEEGEAAETALVVGSRYGCLSLFEEFHQALRDEGPKAVSPTVFTTGVLNAPVGHASLGQGLRGPCHTLVGGEAAGLEAIALAWELVASGAVRRAVAVGVEEAPAILIEALRAASALPAGREAGEGAAAIVLEARDVGGRARVDSVATGRCGRRHGSTEAHAELLRSLAPSSEPDTVWLPSYLSADGEREREACRLAFGANVSLEQWSAGTGYAPGWTSLSVAAQAVVDAGTGKQTVVTGYGGTGSTVALRMSPAS
ncbi:MAG: beta-ketoacyl synthase N-terminal-like domain-containing protein [Planctomycetota bacterium]